MDKKLLAMRNQKSAKTKLSHPAGGLIALGSRPNTPDTMKKSSSSSSLAIGSKRDLFSQSGIANKKPRLESPQQSGMGLYPSRKDPTNDSVWLGLASAADDLTPKEVLSRIRSAEAKLKTTKIPKYICCAIKMLLDHKYKTCDPILMVSLGYVARHNAAYFQETATIEAVCAMLKYYPNPPGSRAKINVNISILGCNLLQSAFESLEEWPLNFIKVYMDDSLGERIWVDRKDCETFIKNLLTAFGTQLPRNEMMSSLLPSNEPALTVPKTTGDMGSSPYVGIEDEASRDSFATIEQEHDDSSQEGGEIRSRFSKNRAACEEYVMEILRDWWSRRLDSVPKQLVRTMSACCGLPEVRLAAAQKLDAWLQNAKLQKPALELLMSTFLNCDPEPSGQTDLGILGCLTKLRTLKTKAVLSVYTAGLKELVTRKSENLNAIMKLVLHNELSTTRAPHNLLVLQLCFQIKQNDAAMCLSSLFIDMLKQRDDYIKALRAFLKEFVRGVLRADFPMVTFAKGLLKAAKTTNLTQMEDSNLHRMINSIIDLVCMTAFLGIGTGIKEAWQTRRELPLVRRYFADLTELECAAISWLNSDSAAQYRPSNEDYVKSFYRVMFLDKSEYYSSVDSWPPEQEKNILLQLVGSAPLNEEIIHSVLLAALTSNRPIEPTDAIDFTEQAVKRAAYGHSTDLPLLVMTSSDLIELLFRCCAYRPPSSIPLPQGYTLPLLAVTSLYWKTWIVLLILSVYNTQLIGSILWESYPTLRFIMTMVMTSDFKFPPSASVTEEMTVDSIMTKETQAVQMEHDVILELESHLANQPMTAKTSHLLPLVCDLSPRGIARKPPLSIIDELKQVNDRIAAGMMLCRCRQPDFLLEIITNQGASQSLPWLIKLIENNEGSLSVLPVQCLCEFLLHQIAKDDTGDSDRIEKPSGKFVRKAAETKLDRLEDIKVKLRDALWNPNTELISIQQALVYFLSRLQAETSRERIVAVRALCMMLCPEGGFQFSQALKSIVSLPHFDQLKSQICTILAKCCLVETDAERVIECVVFLEKHCDESNLESVTSDLAQLIIDRPTVFGRILSMDKERRGLDGLLVINAKFLRDLIEQKQTDEIVWSARADLILVDWSTGYRATLAVRCVSAMILLISQKKPTNQIAVEGFNFLLNAWFPFKPECQPKAYLMDTTEEAELIPDWLRLKMLNSDEIRLVDHALKGLDIAQILMFLQSFGLPVYSVDRLLTLLDRVCESDVTAKELSTLLLQSDGDVSKRLDFIKAQHVRAQENGAIFLNWCKMNNFNGEKETPKAPSRPILKMTPPKLMESTIPGLILFSDSTVDKIFLDEAFVSETLNVAMATRWSKLLAKLATNSEVETKLVFEWLNCGLGIGDKSGITVLKQPKRFQTLLKVLEMSQEKNTIEDYCKKLIVICGEILPQFVLNQCNIIINNSKTEEIPMDTSQEPEMAVTDRVSEIKAILTQLWNSNSTENVARILERYLLVDPEIVSVCPKLQIEAIFGLKSMAGQRYLLTLIPHQARMDTLQTLLRTILANFNTSFNPSSVLDFVWACLRLPRVWIGHDHNVERSEDILGLDNNELTVVLEYVLTEMSSEKYDEKVAKKRLTLILECAPSEAKLRRLVEKLVSDLKEDDPGRRRLLLELYFQKPDLLRFIKFDNKKVFDWLMSEIRNEIHKEHTKLDLLVHRLVSDFFTEALDPKSSDRIESLSVTLRTLAVAHPTVFIRHLSLIDAELRGTTSYTIRRYSNTNYRFVYKHLLKILQTLRPHLFDEMYLDSFEQILGSFLDFVKNHGIRNRNFISYVDETLDLLEGYYIANPGKAGRFLESYTSLIQALSLRYPELPKLQSLLNRVTALQLPMEGQSAESLAAMAGVETLKPVPVRPPTPSTAIQVLPIVRRLLASNSWTEMSEVLSEIDQASYNKPDMLRFVLPQLQTLIVHPDTNCRQLVFTMVVRHLAECPQDGDEFTAPLLAALDHSNIEVVRTAFAHLPKLVVADREGANSLLNCAYNTAVTRSIGEEASKHLRMALEAVNEGRIL